MRLICVTGMHRSGTSAVARVLNLMGVDLGPESSLMDPTEANPKGYWESEPISDLNEELLEALGGRWHRLPVFREGWEHDREFNPFRRRARELLGELFAAAEVAGWKDPRNSILLPFWRTVTSVDSTVLVLREPREVISSLNRRDGMDPKYAAQLWTRYNLAAAVHDQDHVVVSYTALFEDLDGELERLASALSLPQPDDAVRQRARDHLDPVLRRQRGAEEFGAEEIVLAESLYDLLLEDDPSQMFPPLFRELHELFVKKDRLQFDLDRSTDELERRRHPEEQLEQAQREANQARTLATEAGRLEGRLEVAEGQIDSLRAELRKRSDELAETRRAAESEVSQLSERIDELISSREETQTYLAEKEREYKHRIRSLESRLRRSEREFDRLRDRRSVRLALALAAPLRPLFRLVRRWKSRAREASSSRENATGRKRSGGRQDGAEGDRSTQRATREEQDALERRIVQSLPGDPPTSGPDVSIIILNRSGEHHLRRLFPRLATTAYEDFEVVVVDNASEDGSLDYLDSLEPPFRLEVIRNDENRTFSGANNQGVERAGGELILLLNNDIEPMWPGWLGRMVETLQGRHADAVGARLVYPARPGLDNVGDEAHPDLTLQHRGIHFITDVAGVPRPRNLGAGEDPTGPKAKSVREVEGLTAACLLLRKEVLAAVGGLSEGYRYGTEDVDLCLKLREAGSKLVYDGGAALWHHEFGTQNLQGRETKRLNRLHNRDVFVDRWGRRIFRDVMRSKVMSGLEWSAESLHVAITITKDDASAGYGDWFTAHELGEQLAHLGWRVSFVERYDDRWYELDTDVDVLLVLLDAFELPKIRRGIITVAWVRNWTDRWLSRPWFNDFDVVLASSGRSKEIIERRSSKIAHLFPLATNPARFTPRDDLEPGAQHDAVFVGSYWKEPRRVAQALPCIPPDLDIRVFGHGWHKTDELNRFSPRPANYEDLPDIYSAARVVIDDTAHHARPYEAVNARVFDALASGTAVVSDNEAGIRDLFDEQFPTWENAEELQRWITTLRDDPERRQDIVQRYRPVVLEEHTYRRRAEQLREILLAWLDGHRFGICIGVPEREQVDRWGDYHFARAIQRQLERSGHPTRVFLLPEWEEEYVAREDVIIHLFGLSEYRTRGGQLNVMWNISHPERVSVEQCEAYDAIFVASDSFAETLQSSGDVPVHGLYQATDPDRFYPDPGGPEHELLFVGNSRRVRRRIIDDLAATSYDLAIYGADWTRDLVDQRYVRGEHVPNQELRRYYSSAMIVLNDHWDDMREHGFISNRIYDALACGAVVVSDHVEGIDEHLDGSVVTYRTRDELLAHIDRLLEDPEERQSRGRRGREVVLSQHTFAHRVRTMLDVIGPSLGQLPAGIGREAETHGPPSPARSVAS